MFPLDLAREALRDFRPYSSARSSASDAGILLNANESPWPAPTSACNRYPDPQPRALRQQLARIYQVRPEQLLISRGSDEGIDLLTRAFCEAGKHAIVQFPPCFGMYGIAARIQGAAVINLELQAADDFRVPVQRLQECIDENPGIRLVYLTTPNNPTGTTVSRDTVKEILAMLDSRALLIVDEAYIEYTETASAASLLTDYPGLVVLRTLSKAWAGAGLRCGALLADPALIRLLRGIMAPYPLAAPTITTALAMTDADGEAAMAERVVQTLRNKQRLLEILADRPWLETLWEGEANFVLAQVDDARALTRHCDTAGIRIRDLSGQRGLDNCVRITVGSRDELGQLESTLDTYKSGEPA